MVHFFFFKLFKHMIIEKLEDVRKVVLIKYKRIL